MSDGVHMTVFSDASHCPKTLAAGWGAWVKRDGWQSGRTFGGPIHATVNNSSEAEIAAIANTLHCIMAAEYHDGLSTIMIQSDSLNALKLIQKYGPRTIVTNHPAGAPITASGITPSPFERRALDYITNVVPSGIVLALRHVRGHKRGGGRNWVNAQCDAIAKQHMLKQRELRNAR